MLDASLGADHQQLDLRLVHHRNLLEVTPVGLCIRLTLVIGYRSLGLRCGGLFLIGILHLVYDILHVDRIQEVVGCPVIVEELDMGDGAGYVLWYLLVRYLTPLAVLVVFLNVTGIVNFTGLFGLDE